MPELKRTIGFIGLGIMGKPMAKHLLARYCTENGVAYQARKDFHEIANVLGGGT